LSGCARWKLKKEKARASEAGTWGIQQPGNANAPKQRETSTKTPKRPRSEGSTPQKRPELQKGPGTYKEALTNITIVIFRETYPEDKLNEEDQKYILEGLEGCCDGLQQNYHT
jgi:hypothetical protein